VQRPSSTYQANCTKIGTLVDFHLINNFGYGGTLKYSHGSHSNRLKMPVLKSHYKSAFIHEFVSQHVQQLKFANKQVNNYTITSKHEFAILLAHVAIILNGAVSWHNVSNGVPHYWQLFDSKSCSSIAIW